MVTRLYPQPVNFEKTPGRWVSIDNTLVAADRAGYVHRTANDGDALIPRSLSDPFRLVKGGASLTFRLHGSAAIAAVRGDRATFADVGVGVDASYEAVNTGVKELLTLRGRGAQRVFAYDVTASAGLAPRRERDGSITFGDGKGKARFRFAAPVVWDSATEPSVSHTSRLSIERAGDGWTLTLRVDREWLAGAGRVFPVIVDPNVQWIVGGEMRYSGAQRDCTVAGGSQAATSLCADPTLWVGSDAEHSHKSLLYFDARSAIPQDAAIYDATLLLHASGSGTVPASNLRVRPISSDWTDAATWTTRDGTNAWSTAGGDVGSGTNDVGPPTSVGALNSWYYLTVPAELVQGWIWGDRPDFGLQVAADAGSPAQAYGFESTDGDPWKWPAVDLFWKEYQGDNPGYTQDVQKLSDHSQIAVNVANGNLKYTVNDATVPSTDGLDLAVTRNWESVSGYDIGSYGRGWFQTYEQTLIHEDTDGSLYYSDDAGAHYRFAADGSGGFISPSGLDASLCTIHNSGSSCTRDGISGVTYKLTDHTSGRHYYYWGPSGKLGAIRDANGSQVSINWTGSETTISETHGGQVAFDLNADEMVTSMTDGDHTTTFARGGDDPLWLTGVTDDSNHTTSYTYNSDGSLIKITDPEGHQTRIEWQWVPAGSSPATKIIRVLDPTDPTDPTKNPTTTYSYDTANRTTVVTDPAGNATEDVADDGQTTYTYDKLLHVTQATPLSSALPASPAWLTPDANWDTTRPSSEPSGPWHDLHDAYVNGQDQHTLTLGSTDPTTTSGSVSGVRRVAVEEVDGPEIAASTPTCTSTTNPPRTCPTTVSPSVSIDATTLSEGAHTFRQITQDLAGNSGVSASWVIHVDRTAPSAPSNFQQSLFYPNDPDPAVIINWESSDPNLADGSPGSGVATSLVRYSVNGGALSAWQEADGSSIEISGVSVGMTVAIEARSIDGAGHTSATATGSITIAASTEDPGMEDAAAAAYARDYGTSQAVAAPWMDKQGRADGLGETISAGSSGSGYGGMWMDNVNRQVVVNLKSGTSTSGATTALSNAGLSADSRIQTVSYTRQELDDGYDAVDADLADLVGQGLIQLSRRDASNAVHIEVGTDATATQKAQVNTAAANAPVTVTVADSDVPNFHHGEELACVERKDPSGTITGRVPLCDKPLRGGLLLYGDTNSSNVSGICTGGFTASTPDRSSYYLMTAGHCLSQLTSSAGATKWTMFRSDPVIADIDSLGTGAAFVHDQRGDAGLINVASSGNWLVPPPRPWIYVTDRGETRRNTKYRIRSVNTSPEGDYLCMSGVRTGGHCGEVEELRVGPQDHGTLKACVDHGDSGGPVVRRGSARGLLVKLSEKATESDPCHVDFQGAAEAEHLVDAAILTH